MKPKGGYWVVLGFLSLIKLDVAFLSNSFLCIKELYFGEKLTLDLSFFVLIFTFIVVFTHVPFGICPICALFVLRLLNLSDPGN